MHINIVTFIIIPSELVTVSFASAVAISDYLVRSSTSVARPDSTHAIPTDSRSDCSDAQWPMSYGAFEAISSCDEGDIQCPPHNPYFFTKTSNSILIDEFPFASPDLDLRLRILLEFFSWRALCGQSTANDWRRGVHILQLTSESYHLEARILEFLFKVQSGLRTLKGRNKEK